MKYNPTIMEPIRSQLLLRQKEGWQALTGARLPSAQQMDEEESKRIPSYSLRRRQTCGLHPFYQIRHQMGLQQHTNQAGR